MELRPDNVKIDDGFFLVQHGVTASWNAQCSTDLFLYHADGEHVRYTGVVHHWERRDRTDFGTHTFKGHDGRLHASMREAKDHWVAAGQPSFAEPEEWMQPRYATIVGGQRIYPPANLTVDRAGRAYSLPLFDTGYFMVGSWERGRFYHKDGDVIRYTGIESGCEYKDRNDESKRRVVGPEGERYRDLGEAFEVWEAAGYPVRAEPADERLLPEEAIEIAMVGPSP